MAFQLTGLLITPMSAQNQVGDAHSQSGHHNFPTHPALAVGFAMLSTINHTDASNSFAVDAYVYEYQQLNPDPTKETVEGNWPAVAPNNCFGISYIMTLNGCLARGVAVTMVLG